MFFLRRYAHWLHTRWPAGTVERMPLVGEDGLTNVPGLRVVGDLTGIPLLKFSAHTGARAVRAILAETSFAARDPSDEDVHDLIIVGAGVSGCAAALEAQQHGLRFSLLEASQPFSTVVNFPKGKPIFLYPTDMRPDGVLRFAADATVKEKLVEDLRAQLARAGIEPVRGARVKRVTREGRTLVVELADDTALRAHRVIVGIGRSGNARKLGVPGEDLGVVFNRLHDPADFADRDVLVVGGGDSAAEAAIALVTSGARVTLSYRKPGLSRPKPENLARLEQLAEDPAAEVAVEEPSSERVTTASGVFQGPFHRPGQLHLRLGTQLREIRSEEVDLVRDGRVETLPNDAVFAMIGREAPLGFFRRSGVRILGEWRPAAVAGLVLSVLFCTFLYHWKSSAGFDLKGFFKEHHLFPFHLPAVDDPSGLVDTLRLSMRTPSFYYTLAYSLAIAIFGVLRIRRRRVPYVKVQTLSLMAIQIVPLFLLPYVILPWMGHTGCFDGGLGKTVADALFPVSQWDVHGREYWRSVGFILAWPLLVWNAFTSEPLAAWLVIGAAQTFIIIPMLVRKFGKGAYCGWICSCGALAETLGDTHRHKMPHGPAWNRLNLLGQVFLGIAFALLVLRIVAWSTPADGSVGEWSRWLFMAGLHGVDLQWQSHGFPWSYLNYAWFVDLLWAGIIGVALYFHFSGRFFCRFACPLAALMHIYSRFGRFRILAEKEKCISCNICTSVCHQGIDIMNFANKGLPMEDPECVRCSACVQSCPTGVLQFGEIDRRTGEVLRTDRLAASPVRQAEEAGSGR